MLDPTSRLAYTIRFILPSTIYVLLPGFERIDGGLPFERRRYRYIIHIYHPSTFCYSATGNGSGNGMATPYNNRETNVEHSNWTYVITHVKQMWTHVWYLWTPSAEWMVEVKNIEWQFKIVRSTLSVSFRHSLGDPLLLAVPKRLVSFSFRHSLGDP